MLDHLLLKMSAWILYLFRPGVVAIIQFMNKKKPLFKVRFWSEPRWCHWFTYRSGVWNTSLTSEQSASLSL